MKKHLLAAILLAAIIVPTVLFASQGQDTGEARINARQLEDGRIEFAMQVKEGSSWSDRILPRGRYFPTNTEVGKWLNSTPIAIPGTGGLLESLPIYSPWMVMYDNPSLSFCSGYSNCNYAKRDDGGPAQQGNTLISVHGSPLDEQIARAHLAINCVHGGYVSDAHGSWWEEGYFDGQFQLWTDRNARNWLSVDWSQGIVVLARQYSTVDEQQVLREQRFDIRETQDADYRWWKHFDYEWLKQLEGYTDLWVQVRDARGTAVQAHFEIAGLLETPVQLNMEKCGEY